MAHIGAEAAGSEVHVPGGAQREGDHGRPERRVIGMHPDALPWPILVHDALLGQGAVEEGANSVADHRGPPRECGRGSMAAGRPVAVAVTEPVMLHAAAEIGEPGCVGDTHEDASLLGLGDDVGDEPGALIEDAHCVLPSWTAAHSAARASTSPWQGKGRHQHK